MDAPHERAGRLRHALDHASHLLPDQGPIGVFVHHNTLHAFERLPFHQAVQEAARVFGAEPYLPESTYQRQMASRRIEGEDLRAALARFEASLPASRRGPEGSPLPRESVRWLALTPGLGPDDEAWRRWQEEELGAAAVPAALLAACGARRTPRPEAPRQPPGEGGAEEEEVNALLIRWTAAYLDEGVAYWPLAERQQGFFRVVLGAWASTPPGPAPWQQALGREAAELLSRGASPEAAVLGLIDQLGVGDEQLDDWVLRTLLKLRGWAGMMSRLERHPEDRSPDAPPASLLEFLALYALALRAAAPTRARLTAGPAAPEPVAGPTEAVKLARLFHLAGLDAEEVRDMDDRAFDAAADELSQFDAVTRRRVWHEAYEGHYRRQIMGALAAYRPRADLGPRRSRHQVVFCFDEREESIRRHLEEVAPDIETLGAPGFFGLAMDYRGLDAPAPVPLCPVAVRPQHAVEEQPAEGEASRLEQRRERRRAWARVLHHAGTGSRGLVRGALFTALGGMFAVFPLLARVLMPRQAAKLAELSEGLLVPGPRTELAWRRAPGEGDGRPTGFTPDELSERAGNLLENMGLIAGFGPLVVLLGHGSTTQNNPHASAYNCGACGGRHGDASARLFAAAANDPAVRALLRRRGIDVPDGTWFVGGMHDTCSEAITLFDLDRVPASHQAHLLAVRAALDEARTRSAHERCRRFEAAPLDLTPAQALRHVEARSLRIDEPRPEFGHATNAVCIVGRRALTRGLFFDRRAFLISYDPTLDADGHVLERILAAATPVGAGINLEYYFSSVDNAVYGCGTKLPHNITGFLGVMDGHASDLRTGLPLQTVEIHEPMRLLVIVEATRATLLQIAERQAEVRRLVVNGWVRLVAWEPDSGKFHLFGDGGFEPCTPPPLSLPSVASWRDWYQTRRGPLPPSLRLDPRASMTHAA